MMRADLLVLATSILAIACGESNNPSAPGAADRLPRLTVLSGEGQFGVIGQPLAKPLQVQVTTLSGAPIPGAIVSFDVLSGGGTIERQASITDASGIATSGAWKLGVLAGLHRARAQTGILSVAFTAAGCHPGECTPLLFVRDGQIYSFDVISGETGQLTTSGRNAYPTWSPDGRRIAFVRFDENWKADIYMMNADGSNPVRRTTGRNLTNPSWSPDGRTLAVASGGYPYRGEILLLSADGTDAAVQIVENGSLPEWSPDGARIAFVSLSGDDGYQAPHVANADGTNERVISPRDEGAIGRLSWSPDGDLLAYSKCVQGACDVRVVDRLGDAFKRTTNGNVSSPAWAPNGRMIALTQGDASGKPSIGYWTVGDFSEVITILQNAHSPAWRPCIISVCVR